MLGQCGNRLFKGNKHVDIALWKPCRITGPFVRLSNTRLVLSLLSTWTSNWRNSRITVIRDRWRILWHHCNKSHSTVSQNPCVYTGGVWLTVGDHHWNNHSDTLSFYLIHCNPFEEQMIDYMGWYRQTSPRSGHRSEMPCLGSTNLSLTHGAKMTPTAVVQTTT